MMQDFAGKTALVTGSNSGIGKVAAQQLAERGAHVILSGRDKAPGDAAAAEIRLAEVTEVRNVIIIGSGPSGYTAALYAARAELKPLVFEGSVTAGGALMQTTEVENFPGLPDAVMGPELMDAMRKQAERFGAELLSDDVVAVDLTADPKVVKTGSETYLARAVIIATGSRYKELGVPGEKELGGHGVSWCATCDGFFFRGHDIAVIGGGDSAMEEALFLTRFGKSVTVIHRRDTLRASKIMQERAFANPKITFLWDTEVVEVLGSDKVTGLRVRSTKDGTEQVLPVTGVFVPPAPAAPPRSTRSGGWPARKPDLRSRHSASVQELFIAS